VHTHVQRLISVVKMATVLEYVLPKSSVLLCVYCGHKNSTKRIIVKNFFLFTVGIICRVKRFTTKWQNFDDDEEVKTEVRKWLRQKSKDFYAAGFVALAK
jgi:hypothetical protein